MENNKDYNPDVLNCIANLSNDEVFTPPQLVNEMLDLLPQELFSNPQARFLDPFTKSGVFLREIVKRLDVGLVSHIPDRQERILHIMHNQIFGIALTELTSLLARRSVYCSKYADSEHSIGRFKTKEGYILYTSMQHSWQNGRCQYCGASKEVFDRGDAAETYAYNFIHTNNPENFFPNMTFDVIIGNPPYQMNDGGGTGSSAIPLYHKFVEQALKLKPKYLSMIIPARWYAGGKGLDEFRNNMLNDRHISHLVDYANSADCFPSVIIAGGICYFLWEKAYNGLCVVENRKQDTIFSSENRQLNEYTTFVRDNDAVHIIRKVLSKKEKTLDKKVHSRNCFSIISNTIGSKIKGDNDFVLHSLDGVSYIKKNQFADRDNIVDKYKVIITKAMSGGNKPSTEGNYIVVSSLKILKPNEVCTETYLVLDSFDNQKEAENMLEYVKTKLFRFLLLQALTSINISKEKFSFVPLQDFSEPWTDEKLYKKYNLSSEEIAFIESMIRPME